MSHRHRIRIPLAVVLVAAVLVAAAPAAATLAAQAPGAVPGDWWQLEAPPADGPSRPGQWLILNPGGGVQLEMGMRAEGAYRQRRGVVEALDSAGAPIADLRFRPRGDDLYWRGPGGELPMRRLQLIGAGAAGRPPVGVWHVRPVPDAEPVRVQFTAGGCVRVMTTLRRVHGPFALDGDSLRLTVTSEPSRPETAAAVRGDTLEFREDLGGGRRFVRAPEAGAMLPNDRRCTAPGR